MCEIKWFENTFDYPLLIVNVDDVAESEDQIKPVLGYYLPHGDWTKAQPIPKDEFIDITKSLGLHCIDHRVIYLSLMSVPIKPYKNKYVNPETHQIFDSLEDVVLSEV